MPPVRRSRLVVAAATIALAGSLAGCSGGSPHGDLTLGDDSFAPAVLTEAAGATVTVANPSSMTHDVVVHGVPGAGGVTRTAAIRPGASTSFTAPTKPGRYALTCDFHPDMRATLVVP